MTRNDIIHKKFSRAFRGYDPAEVDAFLDEIVRELDKLEQARSLAETRAELLEKQLKKGS
ncbi:MAG: DivIVA domain-containing protein [Clostridiaceae bacterium]|nr:DivIVA domain-containing protein [Eubacteriales bacterium]